MHGHTRLSFEFDTGGPAILTPRSPRMSDVAKLAGVSTMTVSRVLNNTSNVNEETRARVMQAISQLQYRRNEVARSLREQSSRQIGILVPNLYDEFFASSVHAVSLVAKKHDYSVVISTHDENQSTEYDEICRMMRFNIDGLVVVPAIQLRGTPSLIDKEFEHLPVVTLDRPLLGGHFDQVLIQNKRGAQLGTEHLIQLGHKRILFFRLSRALYTMRRRQQGYMEAMTAAGLRPDVFQVSDAPQDTLAALRSRLASKSPPTALFSANNLLTRYLLDSIHVLGMHPPDPLALVGFDDFEAAGLLRPGVTVVRQPTPYMGRLAGEMLFSRLGKDGDDSPAKRIMLPVELVVRGSCGAEV